MTSRDQAKHLYYDLNASKFDEAVNKYDLNTRLTVVYETLLNESLKGKLLLDDGCGTGWFSKAAVERGALVTSLDVGPALLAEVAKKCDSTRVVGDALSLEFPDNTFDIVVSSEMIEHTVNPRKAVAEMFRVLRPGGVLALTSPNKFWKWSLHLAQIFKVRSYGHGYENWPGFRELKSFCIDAGFSVEKHLGFHLFPFQLDITHPALRILDRAGEYLGPLYVNQGIRAIKK